MRARRPRGDRRAGFTLIETLVALIVFAVVAVVAQRGIVTTRLGLDRALSMLSAEEVARSIVETQLGSLVTGPGETSGETNGVAWTITAEPIALPLPPAPPPPRAASPSPDRQAPDAQAQAEPDVRWALLRVTVSVANGRGKPLRIETAHAVRAEP